ncbi:MAG: hypothetical protein PVF70_02260 [Anaerolineales bacterium]|jgi:hypothetical protein
MVRTYAGGPWALSLWPLASALVLLGVALIIFFPLLASIGIAATPWDRYLAIHLVFVSILSLAFLVVLISYSIAIFRSERYPKMYAWVFMACAAVLAFSLFSS